MLDLEERLREQLASLFTLSRSDNLTTEQLRLRLRKVKGDPLLHEKIGVNGISHELATPEDEDDQDQYNYPFGSTHLEFSHASVRDYLLRDGRRDTRKWPDDLGIGIDVDKAQYHIAATLLDVLCDKNHDAEFGDGSLSSHALHQCLEHLPVCALA